MLRCCIYGGVVLTIDDTGDLPWIGPSPFSTLNATFLPISPRKQDKGVLLFSLHKSSHHQGFRWSNVQSCLGQLQDRLYHVFPCSATLPLRRRGPLCRADAEKFMYNASIEILHGFEFSTSQMSARDFDSRSLDGLIESYAKRRG